MRITYSGHHLNTVARLALEYLAQKESAKTLFLNSVEPVPHGSVAVFTSQNRLDHDCAILVSKEAAKKRNIAIPDFAYFAQHFLVLSLEHHRGVNVLGPDWHERLDELHTGLIADAAAKLAAE